MKSRSTSGVTQSRSVALRRSVAVLLWGVAACAGALTTCPQCAYEQADDANFCTHCGVPMRSAEGRAGASVAVSSSAASVVAGVVATNASTLVAQAVAEDVQSARDLVAQDRPAVARAVLANALALSAVAPTALTPAQGEQLMAETRRCEQLLMQASIACSACEGTGKRSLRFDHLTGETGTVTASGQGCLTCRGTGQVRRTRSTDDLKFVLGQARQQADLALQSRGRIPVGGAWIPAALKPLMDDTTEARLRHAAAAPCAACQGIGRTDCTACGNTGFVPCKERGCEQGWIVKEELNLLGDSSSLKRRERCPTCGGSARVACAECRGVGALTCKICSGTGKRLVCTACKGNGTATCRVCRGEGAVRGKTCAECGADGVVLCTTCGGDGYRSR